MYNYFGSPTKLFLDLKLAKFLDALAKSFFSLFYIKIKYIFL